jgi:hypothetical protein
MPNGAVPTFTQIAGAMAKIVDLQNADPPPPAAAKQSLLDVYQTLVGGLSGIAGDGDATAAVSSASKQLQDMIDSGSPNADAISQIQGSLQPAKPAAAPLAQPPQPPAAAPPATTGGSTAPSALSDRVPIPPRDQMNVGLSACTESEMLKKFGVPGSLTRDCSAATGKFLARVRQGFNVGPWKVTGLDYAVESLSQVFADVKKDNQALYDQVKNVGMLCVRARRQNPSHFSNHSWGTAIDIYFGTAVVPQGVRLAHRGNLLLAPYFNKHGWYWGAGFSGDSIDSMHFELAEETIPKIPDQPMFDAPAPSSALAEAGALAPQAPSPAPSGYKTDPASAKLLGDVLPLIGKAKPVRQNFNFVTFAGTLAGGQLVFQSQLQLDTDGWPDGQSDPDWQRTTSLRCHDGNYVNANEVPYFVLPGGWYSQFGIKLGDLAAIIYKDKLAFAVFADTGPKTKLGEASLELFRLLGEERLRPNGKVIDSGMGGGITTIVFPGSYKGSPYQDQESLLNYVETRGKVLFLQLGGTMPDEV